MSLTRIEWRQRALLWHRWLLITLGIAFVLSFVAVTILLLAIGVR